MCVVCGGIGWSCGEGHTSFVRTKKDSDVELKTVLSQTDHHAYIQHHSHKAKVGITPYPVQGR